MVIKPEPVAAALEAVIVERGPMHTILLTPSGAPFDQRAAERLAGKHRIALLCGRYEGIDDRIREHFVDECLSLGDFVLNGGEVAAAAIIEAVARLREGVLGNPESIATERPYHPGMFARFWVHDITQGIARRLCSVAVPGRRTGRDAMRKRAISPIGVTASKKGRNAGSSMSARYALTLASAARSIASLHSDGSPVSVECP